jgi:hypothetical protein
MSMIRAIRLVTSHQIWAAARVRKRLPVTGHGRMIRVTRARIIGEKSGARVTQRPIKGDAIVDKNVRSRFFTEITHRNALRKQAKLPLLDVRTEMRRALNLEAWRQYYQRWDEHAERYRAIVEAVLEEGRAERGPDFGRSWSGRLLVDFKSRRIFEAYLARLGVNRPELLGGVQYGSGGVADAPSEF